EGASLVGFTPDAVAIAVRRALGEATSWSDHTVETVHPQSLLPIINPALDQVLLEEVAAGRRGPTLRMWEWSDDCGVIGSFQSLSNEVDSEQAAELGVQVVRRISGGGAMFMEPGNRITYAEYVRGARVAGLCLPGRLGARRTGAGRHRGALRAAERHFLTPGKDRRRRTEAPGRGSRTAPRDDVL